MSLIHKPGGGAYAVNGGVPAGMMQNIPLISPDLMKRIQKRLGVSALNPTIDIKQFIGLINSSVGYYLDYLDAEDAKSAADNKEEEAEKDGEKDEKEEEMMDKKADM